MVEGRAPPPHAICTHIYPLQVAVGLRRGNHSIISVDDGHDVHAQQLLQCAVQVLPLVVIVEIQICHQDLTAQEGRQRRELIVSDLNMLHCIIQILFEHFKVIISLRGLLSTCAVQVLYWVNMASYRAIRPLCPAAAQARASSTGKDCNTIKTF